MYGEKYLFNFVSYILWQTHWYRLHTSIGIQSFEQIREDGLFILIRRHCCMTFLQKGKYISLAVRDVSARVCLFRRLKTISSGVRNCSEDWLLTRLRRSGLNILCSILTLTAITLLRSQLSARWREWHLRSGFRRTK